MATVWYTCMSKELPAVGHLSVCHLELFDKRIAMPFSTSAMRKLFPIMHLSPKSRCRYDLSVIYFEAQPPWNSLSQPQDTCPAKKPLIGM
jgi:hypothetical protein